MADSKPVFTEEDVRAIDRRRQLQIENQVRAIDRLLDGETGYDGEMNQLHVELAASQFETEQLKRELAELRGKAR